jgi:glycosyltransferase involved in cell wall biosynthesis
MRIAINTRFLLSHKMEGFGWFTFETTKRMVINHPEHTFYFFFDRKFDAKFIFAPNVIPVVLNPPARHPFLFIIWFEVAVRLALRKHKIDLLLSPDGYLSLGSKTPQIAVIHDLNFVHNPSDVPFLTRKYLQFFFPKFAQKAKKIFTVSEYSKQDLITTYGILEDKIDVGHNGASELFIPQTLEENELTREKYANGKEYVLHVGALHKRKNVHRLIEAFEKTVLENKRQENLVIVGAVLFKSQKEIFATLSEKVKDRILFVGHLQQEELVRVVAAAKIFAYIPYFEGFGIPLVEAMQCGTPVLSGNLTSLPEVGKDAVLYCNPLDVSDIAKNLSLLLNDELLCKELIRKGLQRSKDFSWDKSAQLLWQCIEIELESILQ